MPRFIHKLKELAYQILSSKFKDLFPHLIDNAVVSKWRKINKDGCIRNKLKNWFMIQKFFLLTIKQLCNQHSLFLNIRFFSYLKCCSFTTCQSYKNSLISMWMEYTECKTHWYLFDTDIQKQCNAIVNVICEM